MGRGPLNAKPNLYHRIPLQIKSTPLIYSNAENTKIEPHYPEHVNVETQGVYQFARDPCILADCDIDIQEGSPEGKFLSDPIRS